MTTTKRTPKYETIHEHVNSTKEAWEIADRYFPTDYELVRSEPYPIWKSTSTVRENAFYCQIADLCTRLEVTIVEDNWDTTVVNIWIDDDEPETTETETTSDESDEHDSESTTDAKVDETESRNSDDSDKVTIQLDRLSVCDLLIACTEIVIECKMEMASDVTDKITEYRRAHVLPDTIKKWQRLHDAVEKQLDEHDKKYGIDW